MPMPVVMPGNNEQCAAAPAADVEMLRVLLAVKLEYL
jgi:hypothetical protein